jgi:hypothetical protein
MLIFFYVSLNKWEMASIEEVWGSSFPKKYHNMASKYSGKPEERDAEQEGRIFPTPIHRTAAALQKNKKTIDDLSKSLPIGESDEQQESNYHPARVNSTVEKMTNFSSTKQGFTKPFFPDDSGLDFAYAPTSFQRDAYDIKLDRIMRMVEQNKTGYESPSSHDMMLYIFTGVFFLFTFDTFVNLGKRMR